MVEVLQLRAYSGPLLAGDRPHPRLAALLGERDLLIELGPRAHRDVLLGVPHHAAVGVDRIAERSPSGGRVADENAVLYALACLARLRDLGVASAAVVAAHASDHDPNKRRETPYCRRVLGDPLPRLLVECHGAGARAPHDLEVSAGRNLRSRPLEFGGLLARALGPGFHVAAQTAPGGRAALIVDARPRSTPSVLRFPALRTTSLHAAADRGIAALHVEAKPRFRSRGDGSARLTRAGRSLGESLALAIARYVAAEGA
jgi:hypothetical protein